MRSVRPFPVYATILAVFTQRFAGPAAAANLLRGVVYGIFAAATFFLVVAALMERLGIAPTFLLACLAALLVQGATLRLLRGRREKTEDAQFNEVVAK